MPLTRDTLSGWRITTIRPGDKKRYRGDRLHEDGAPPLLAQLRVLVLRQPRLPGLPYLRGKVADDGELELGVLLRECRHPVALHHRIGVFEAIAEASRRGIDDDLLLVDPKVAKQDVELFRQVDVYGRGRHDDLAVTDGHGSYLLVVLVRNGTDGHIPALAGLGDPS